MKLRRSVLAAAIAAGIARLELAAGPGRWTLDGRLESGQAALGWPPSTGDVHSSTVLVTTGFRR